MYSVAAKEGKREEEEEQANCRWCMPSVWWPKELLLQGISPLGNQFQALNPHGTLKNKELLAPSEYSVFTKFEYTAKILMFTGPMVPVPLAKLVFNLLLNEQDSGRVKSNWDRVIINLSYTKLYICNLETLYFTFRKSIQLGR